MTCQSLVGDYSENVCGDPAKFRVSSDAGWTGAHCKPHTLRVVRTMLPQVEAGGYTMHIEKIR